MIVLTRRHGEEILLDKGKIQIKILHAYKGKVAIGINAPTNMDIERKEFFLKKQQQGRVESE